MADGRFARSTSTNYAKPYRPAVIRAVNGVGMAGRAVGFKLSLSPAVLMKAARKRMKKEDFGLSSDNGPSFLEAFDVLVESIEREAFLTPFGRFVTRERLRGTLENRLRAQYWFSKHPEILAAPLPPLAVITGLQRTGTTLLHRLLASDPHARALASWEAINPAPTLLYGGRSPKEIEKDRQARIGKAIMSQKALSFLAPDFFAIHPVEALAPEEDVLLLDYSFLSTVPEATLRVPSYSLWVEEQDQRPAYEYMKNLLKLLHWQKPGKWWVLKTPHHLEYIDTLTEVFPGTKIIQTHRDPAVTLASFFSMVCHGRGVFSGRVDPKEVAGQWGRKIERMMDRALASRRRLPDNLFFDLSYDDFIRNPMMEIEKIYDFLGLSLTGDAVDAMKRTLKESRQYKYGMHTYRLGDFGVRKQEIRERFRDYYDIFGEYIFGEETYEQAQA